MRWERETAAAQKESTSSWFVRAGGSSGACDTMGEGGESGPGPSSGKNRLWDPGSVRGREKDARERWGREGRIKGHGAEKSCSPHLVLRTIAGQVWGASVPAGCPL